MEWIVKAKLAGGMSAKNAKEKGQDPLRQAKAKAYKGENESVSQAHSKLCVELCVSCYSLLG